MLLLRAYLLTGLIAHKLIWEVLKRRQGAAPQAQATLPLRIRIVQTLKIGVLLGLVVQTVAPPLLPIRFVPVLLPVIGIILYTAGLCVAVAGRIQLGQNWTDIEMGTVRPNHAVVSSGIYRLVRHPIYAGDLAMLFGMELALRSWLICGVFLLLPFVIRKALAEEHKLLTSIRGYREYCEGTRRFLPIPPRKLSRTSR